MRQNVKVLFIVPYPLGMAPSQRFRVEIFLPELRNAGIQYLIEPFLGVNTWKILYKKDGYIRKVWGILKGFLKRWEALILKIPSCNYVFIHREAAPVGPPVFEWIIAKILRKKIIYDFDDAIWISSTSSVNRFVTWFKAAWKVKYICTWAHKVITGNDFLYEYASQFNGNVIKIPTCIDIKEEDTKIKRHQGGGALSIGWTGSHSTLKYLEEILPVINELQKDFDFNFIVIADQNPLLPIKNFQFIPWSAATEQKDLLKLDIGIMPLIADAWSEGKCGFKLIQYFSVGIPAAASPVGVNKVIIEEGINGFLCGTKDEWKVALQKLLNDKTLREQMGAAGRKKVLANYSLQSQAERFIELFSLS